MQPQESTAPEPSQSEPGQATTPETGFIGFDPNEQPEPSGAQTAQFRLAETLQPDTVVAYDGDKPITAQEVQNGYFRQSDYSRKTQELAESRKSIESQQQWFEANKTYIEGLQSPDPEQRAAVLTQLADAFGVRENLARSFAPARERAPDGKFTAAKTDLLDPDEYDEISRPVVLAANAAIERANALEAQNKALDDRFGKLEQTVNQFQEGLQTAQQQQQLAQEIATLSAGWQERGFKDVDAGAAMALVGKPITSEQAMFLAHREQLLKHNYAAAEARFKAGGKVPNEPGSVRSVERRPDYSGMTLSERLERAGEDAGFR